MVIEQARRSQMKWNPRIQEILNTLAAQHPEMVADDTGPRMRLNTMFVEQVAFEFGSTYGMKSAGTGRPLSSETLAHQDPQGRLICWSWENKHNGEVEQFPESEDITGQIFSAVTPVNHIYVQRHDNEEETIPGDKLTSSQSRLEQKLDDAVANQSAIAARLVIIEGQLAQLDELLRATQEALTTRLAHQDALLKQADDNNERRYLDVV